MECKLDALLAITLENRNDFHFSHPFPPSLPFPLVSVVGTLKGSRRNPYYPLFKIIQKIYKCDSDGVVTVPDQTIPGSQVITLSGTSHALGITDPIPFWGALFATLLSLRKSQCLIEL
jgi:hypothetical protein